MHIYRNGAIIASTPIDENTVLTYQLMGEHKVACNIVRQSPLEIKVGDYIMVNEERFIMNQDPVVKNEANFYYNIIFEAEIYTLYNKILMDEGSAIFTYFGTPEEFLTLLINNINSIDSDWTLGDVEAMEPKFISFQGDSCRSALTRIAETFKLEYKVKNKEISLSKSIGVDTPYTFQYGRNNGLYSLTRRSIDNNNIITRLYAFGSTRNLSVNYRDGQKNLVFESKYLEANTDLYGVREGIVTFEDIYPNRTGEVTSTSEETKVIDTSIDFDINDYLLAGQTAKIVFKSGALSGYEFEITNYDHGTKEITFNTFTEANDYVLPNEISKPEVGDKYTLIGIDMPQSYIDAAEAKLLEKAQERLVQVSSPRVTYELEMDRIYIRQKGLKNNIFPGDRIRVLDDKLGIDQMIRISSVSYPLKQPDVIQATISDQVTYTTSERIIKETVNNKSKINIEESTRAEGDRLNLQKIKAINAEILNLIVKNLRTNETGQRIEILEAENSLKFYDQDDELVLQIDDDLGNDIDGNPISGLRVTNPANGRTSYISAGGMFTNAGSVPFISEAAGSKTNASIAGLLFDRNTDPNGISAAVAGLDGTSSGDSASYGGWFNSVWFGGIHLAIRSITADHTILKTDSFISCDNSTAITVTLPLSPRKGATYFIRRNNASGVSIASGSANIKDNGTPVSSIGVPSQGDLVRITWEGGYWLFNKMG
ncbi:phage tail protein [Echinicola marina]|uniref:phage tail protein n=1 Tax=Echinicola marina TaxID=2859768 RepID=UPI001CF6FF7D|nr:phage tail protein [Echinicola marina]UCS94857.1 phage tail protein [Echinicola marina]